MVTKVNYLCDYLVIDVGCDGFKGCKVTILVLGDKRSLGGCKSYEVNM